MQRKPLLERNWNQFMFYVRGYRMKTSMLEWNQNQMLSIVALYLLFISTTCEKIIHNYATYVTTSFLAGFSFHQVFELIMDNTILLGPWGGNGGNSWDDGVHTGVRDITLVYGSCIDSIRVTYDKYGRPFPAEKHGGMGGTKTAQIKLHFPEEVLISVSGHYCPVVYGGGLVIRSLTFKSNQRTFGPFGVEEGTPFNFLTNRGHIVGLYGRSGWFIDSLGFVLAPKISLFHRIHMMFRGFNPFAIKDDEHQKTKGSKGYSWGI